MVAPAHREHGRAVSDRCEEIPRQVGISGQHPLRVILPTPEEDDVAALGNRFGSIDGEDVSGNAAEAQALSEHEGVATVTVRTEQAWSDDDDGDCSVSHLPA